MDSSIHTNTGTIEDFGNQWQIHGRVDADYWTDPAILGDYVGPLLNLDDLRGTSVAEVGSGSGRIVRMLSKYEPVSLHAVEPSAGFDMLQRNTADLPNLQLHRERGDSFRIGRLDFIFSLGVIQFIPDPLPTLKNIRDNLADGGKFVIWVYGRENNRLYLAFFRGIHSVTRNMNDRFLDRVCAGLNYMLMPYIFLCRYLRLPMRKYLLEVFARCGMEKRKYIIFDQLNPRYAKYYRRDELVELLAEAGFRDIRMHHRHGYSWTAVANR